MKTLEQLIVPAEDSGIPFLNELKNTAACSFEIIPVENQEDANTNLFTLQVSTHSTLGTVAFYTGGILIDEGWVRVFGSASSRLNRSIVSWNTRKTNLDGKHKDLPNLLLIADDVIGGSFAINRGELGPESLGHVYYFSPDGLEWEDLEIGYTDWMQWLVSGSLNKFYFDYRWLGWQSEVSRLGTDRGYLILPPPIAEGSVYRDRDFKETSIAELFGIYHQQAFELNKKGSQ
eukprot:TRINITY_DN5375_c0_g1_i1.p1 TRINITY_DN5375_c0_g1~~TRINITY_DN5375_c0_g1_i1.p1  ORF type:complete len:232 (-),score=43.68 TRINITY_DN5375_c0_g1_i1:125-820(-)